MTNSSNNNFPNVEEGTRLRLGSFFSKTFYMTQDNRPKSKGQQNSSQQGGQERVKNPFENNQSADQDIQQSQEKLDKEQQFKEALTERD